MFGRFTVCLLTSVFSSSPLNLFGCKVTEVVVWAFERREIRPIVLPYKRLPTMIANIFRQAYLTGFGWSWLLDIYKKISEVISWLLLISNWILSIFLRRLRLIDQWFNLQWVCTWACHASKHCWLRRGIVAVSCYAFRILLLAGFLNRSSFIQIVLLLS